MEDYRLLESSHLICEPMAVKTVKSALYSLDVDDYTSGYMPSLVMVYNSSRVFWGPVIRFRSSCQIDITFFPFDTQVCKLKMGSWAYTGLQVNVWNSSHTMDLSNLVDNGEWELLGVAVKRNVVFYNCCKEPFPDVTFSIQLRRRTKYYFMNIIIPCIILSFLCLGGFLLPPESGEKITLGLSVLLTITVFMLMVADKMPQTSESISVISELLSSN
ncbi:neuronal acetylcholine receptor subunit alpha-10 [Plakobranchus ocellatus]|uniref:Neuronal acetylcholine receptor subunit alpha-10 n=1 Tax=Plakobranchus ocellatus TaxID=259542 RepID=A0AAV4A5T7_9GAST|nr:neuronal acetylcholine receptor subunit alpha-10 [Plakobranchus ocellatus]